jgi:hypothetical protein
MMKKVLYSSAYFLPVLALAQDDSVGGLVPLIGNIINALVPIVVALALLYFFWGLARYILSAGDDGGKSEARMQMIWGIIALFVIVSVWGIVGLLGDTLGIQQGDTIIVPTVPTN